MIQPKLKVNDNFNLPGLPGHYTVIGVDFQSGYYNLRDERGVDGSCSFQAVDAHAVIKQDIFQYIADWKREYGCQHTWSEYVGITEAYKFCTKCDTKETL